jgi:SAM-dependent methyltransferase
MNDPVPFVFDDTGEAKRYAPATERNREAIAEALERILPNQGTVLEIASGTGEHLIHFAQTSPHLNWQPSDYDDAGLASIAAWSAEAGLPNILPPLRIDAISADWPPIRADAILCINMIHISPWEATQGLMAGAGRLLAAGAPLYLYGPYRQHGVALAEGNVSFDASLKQRNPDWGLRYVEDVAALGMQAGFKLDSIEPMPANNLSLIFYKS